LIDLSGYGINSIGADYDGNDVFLNISGNKITFKINQAALNNWIDNSEVDYEYLISNNTVNTIII
jgi:hypothetical protein